MTMVKSLGCCVLLASGMSAWAQQQIIPKPVSIQQLEGAAVTFDAKTGFIVLVKDEAMQKAAKHLQQQLSSGTGLPLKWSFAESNKPLASSNNIVIRQLDVQSMPNAEAYSIECTKEGVVISASSPKGILHAGSSLVQMLPVAFHDSKADKGATVWQLAAQPFVIKDQPRFAYRGLMLDEARHFFGEQAVKQLLDQMALLKMNVLHWGLTNDAGWRIEIKKYPRLTEIGSKRKNTEIGTWRSGKYSGQPHEGFYTQEQIKQLVSYAAERGITIIPEINMPGHASAAIVAYPELGLKPLKEIPAEFVVNSAYDPTNENTYRFLSDVLDEVVALFPSPIIHMGGDEVRYNDQWKGQPKIEQFMAKNGIKNLGGVQMYFSNRMAEIIRKKGRHAMGWNEIYGEDVNHDGGGKSEAKLDKDAVIHFWKGDAELAKRVIRAGHDVVNGYHSNTYLDYSYGTIPLAKAYNFEPVFYGLEPEYHAKIKGLSAQMWTEWTPTLQRMHYMAFPRSVAFAEVGWSRKEQKNYSDFKKRLEAYGKRMELMGINYAKDITAQVDRGDFFNTPKLGQWDSNSFGGEPVVYAADMVKAAGDYVVTLFYDSGKEGAPIESVSLLEDGQALATDSHEGFSGQQKRQIQYKLHLKAFKPQAKYAFSIKFKTAPGLDSKGTIYCEIP